MATKIHQNGANSLLDLKYNIYQKSCLILFYDLFVFNLHAAIRKYILTYISIYDF